MPRVFVTGGSGFVGSAVVAELLSRGNHVNALANKQTLATSANVRPIKGGLFDPALLEEGIRGCDAVIHLVGIIMENPSKKVTFDRIHFQGTQAVIDAAVRQGVRRYVQMSALGARPGAVSQYHQTKFKAEEYVRASGLDWTILRPSLIHGPDGAFMRMEAMWARKRAPAPLFIQPVMPYFGGKYAGRLQPVYVNDVARAFVDCLEKPDTIGKTYDLGGPDILTWPELHQTVAMAVVGHPRLIGSVPIEVGKLLAAVGVAKFLGFNRDQVIMSQEDNTCDLAPFIEAFGWTPQRFAPLVQKYGKQL